MRINFVLPGYHDAPIGGHKVVYEYANHLARRGHLPRLIMPRTREPRTGLAGNILNATWAWRTRRKNPKLVTWFDVDPRVEIILVPDLRERGIPPADATFATMFNTARYVARYSAAAGKKMYLIQHFEDWAGDRDEVLATWRLPLHKVVVARWLEQIAIEQGEGGRTTWVPNSIDHSVFRLSKPIEGRPPSVMMLFHNESFKAIPDGLRAIEIARKAVPELSVTLFGVPERPDDLDPAFAYHQTPSNLPELYNRHAVFLHPSRVEGWGLPAAEAMACGCALVCAANGGVTEFANEENAFLAPVADPESLGNRLVEALTQTDVRTRKAAAGRRDIQAFRWERSVDLLLEAIDRAAEPV
ncbi:MAG: glycosyltransferase family 4 protein [Fimbriimonadaceae bacterium]